LILAEAAIVTPFPTMNDPEHIEIVDSTIDAMRIQPAPISDAP
jgi:hypothetical protein